MIYLVRLKPIIVIYLIFLVSCGKTNYEINNNLIKNTFIDTSQVITQDIKNDLFATMSIDTLRCNQNLTYNQALNFLRNKFIQIDTISENIETKTYLKSLYLSEFVYASFSFQFLGSQLGKTNHQIAIENWDKMPLETCYNRGNSNLVPVWCGDRTSFYVRLLDSLLGLKATTISIKNIHTFPLVNIGNRRFIFDPYDPFVIFDSLKIRVMDYDEALKYCLNKNVINIFRTKRLYGDANELVSNVLTRAVLSASKNEKQNFSQKLIQYLIVNQSYFLKNINKCSFESYNKKGIIYNSNLKDDKYIIRMQNNLKNFPMNFNHFKKYYYGIDCK